MPHPSIYEGEEGPGLTPLGEGFELYRHKVAENMPTRNWHGYHWARRTEKGDYEILALISVGVGLNPTLSMLDGAVKCVARYVGTSETILRACSPTTGSTGTSSGRPK